MTNMRLILICTLLFQLAAGRFFDVCPARRLSIGACLAGLCPAGSECINSYCCKLKTTTPSTQEISAEENSEYGRCKNGRFSIGECISGSCPKGYKCENELCCKPGLPPVRVTMIPVEITTTSSTTRATISEAESEEEYEENIFKSIEKPESREITEIESIKNSFKKGSSGSGEDYEKLESSTEDYDLYLNIVDQEKEETRYISTTSKPIIVTIEEEEQEVEERTTVPQTTTPSRRRYKTRRPTTSTTTTSEPETTTTESFNSTESVESTLLITGCPVGEPIGECVSNQCPEGHACFHGNCCILTPQINCTDVLPGCLSHLCNKRGYDEFMTKKCPRTCAKCHVTDLDKSELVSCRDRRQDCNEWAAEGFCESTLYTTRQKLKFCGKSCKLC